MAISRRCHREGRWYALDERFETTTSKSKMKAINKTDDCRTIELSEPTQKAKSAKALGGVVESGEVEDIQCIISTLGILWTTPQNQPWRASAGKLCHVAWRKESIRLI